MTQWPADIPSPFVDYSGSLRGTLLQSRSESAIIARRARFFSSYSGITVSWVLSASEYLLFQTFFHTTLSDGTALFSLSLRYPKNTELVEWVVRFFEGYEARYEEGLWVIRADLDLVRKAPIGDPVVPFTHGAFFTVDELSTGGFQEFGVLEGVSFYTMA